MEMRKVWMSLLVVAVVMTASAAVAGLVVMQNTAADQGIVDDTQMDTGNWGDLRNYGHGGNDGANRDDLYFYRGLEGKSEASLIRFNNIAAHLPPPVAADPSKITKVTLALYQENVGYAGETQNDGCSFYRLKRNWDEGTLVFANVGSPVDGATSRNRIPGVQNPAGWTRTGGTSYVWELSVADTVAVVGYNTNSGGSYHTPVSSIAEVDAAAKRWWYDPVAQKLYVNKNDDGSTSPDASSQGICYYTTDQAWQEKNASGDNDCDKADPIDLPSDYYEWQVFGVYNQNYDPTPNVNKWVYVISDRGDEPTEAYLLDWVRGWVDGSIDNYGMVFAKGLNGNEWNNRRFTPSDAHQGASDYSYGPKLTIEFDEGGPVPEPAGLGLLGAALLAWRRKRRS
jgi:MYXO-CTERM domain-containing protein